VILLDTHVVYWAVCEPRRLSRAAVRSIERSGVPNGLAIASVTLFELAGLFRGGRIRENRPLAVASAVGSIVTAARVKVLDITVEIAAAATEFPHDFPHDPMDRLIAATARAYGCPLVTKDQRMQESPLVQTIW